MVGPEKTSYCESASGVFMEGIESCCSAVAPSHVVKFMVCAASEMPSFMLRGMTSIVVGGVRLREPIVLGCLDWQASQSAQVL